MTVRRRHDSGGDHGGSVGLVLPAHDQGGPRVYFSRGAILAADRLVDGIAYRPGALVPSSHWWEADARQRCALVPQEGPTHPGTTIDVVQISAGVLLPLAELAFNRAVTLEDCQKSLRDPRYLEALDVALPNMMDLFESEVGIQLLGTCVQRGGLWSTTTHADARGLSTFSGLHVDDWDRLPWRRRRESRRQLCLNLGCEDRVLVFVPQPVDQLVLGLGMEIAGSEIYGGITRLLFERSPETLLCKVRIRPGEAYIAPTDNLIHDGSTHGNSRPDVNLNVRGHFRSRCSEAAVPARAERVR
jgi:hypothetical protein